MKNENRLKFLDYFFINRPILFFPGWNTLLAGYLVAQGDVHFLNSLLMGDWQFYFRIPGLEILMAGFAAAMGGSFILNQLKDIETDRKNRKLFLIGENHLTFREAVVESAILIVFSLVIGFALNELVMAFLLIFILITGYFYNYRPFQFKDRPIWGLLLNMLMGWIAFALGWVFTKGLTTELLLRSLPYLFLNTGLYFLTTIPDMKGDRESGKLTFSVAYGFRQTIFASLICFLAAGVTGLVLRDDLILSVFILVLFWMFQMVINQSQKTVIKTVKLTITFFSFIICTKFPLYLLLMVAIFLLTRYYYSNRFEFDYPNFRGE